MAQKQSESQSQDIKKLVSQLESHLNQTEISLKSQIKVTLNSADTELDDLFLQKEFNKLCLIQNIPIIKNQQAQISNLNQKEQEILENKLLEEANKRLKHYIDTLNEQIIRIVESESEEFLSVAGKLEKLKDILSDLKDSVKEFHKAFSVEKDQTNQIFSYLNQQYQELSNIIKEKEKLERLVMMQIKYSRVESLIKKLDLESDYIEYEECVRILKDLRVSCQNDYTINHQLALLEKDLNKKINDKFYNFIHKSHFFKASQNQSQDDAYFNECELASFLRVFKTLQNPQQVYDQIQNLVVKPIMNNIVKKAFDAKQHQILVMRGDTKNKLPFQIFINGIKEEILKGAMKGIIEMTTNENENYNFVSGFNVIQDCICPLVISNLDSSLSFVYSTANLQLFQKNYLMAKDFNEYLSNEYPSTNLGLDLIQKFNLQTYLNVLIIENTDRFTQDLDKQFDQTNDQIKPPHQITLNYATKILNDDHYLPEIGEKLIKLSIQFVIRHLNYVLDKVNEKKTLGTERILFILEDLNSLQQGLETNLKLLIASRINQIKQDLTLEEIQSQILVPMLKEIIIRFDYLIDPCLQGISSKLYQRLQENLQVFKQTPPLFRMTNRPISLEPSQFVSNVLRPLHNLSDQKVYQNLSLNIKFKLYDQVLKSGFKDLNTMLQEIISEESKMHESLRKYKKDSLDATVAQNSDKNVSDFDKMLLQFYVVSSPLIYFQDIREMEKEIKELYGESYRENRFDDQLQNIYQQIERGKVQYERLNKVNAQQ